MTERFNLNFSLQKYINTNFASTVDSPNLGPVMRRFDIVFHVKIVNL